MMRKVRPDDGLEYYGYILLYVDDVLSIAHDAEAALHELNKYFPMKPGSIGDPDMYLGAKLRKVQLDNGVFAWSQSSSKYVQEAVKNLEQYLHREDKNYKLSRRATAPWPTGYNAERDITPELDAKGLFHYQSMVGILRWMVELGRVDIITETSKLASYMAQPREGHLEAVYHVFAYLKKKHDARIVYDPTYPEIEQDQFIREDWSRYYGDVKEPEPSNVPVPLGKAVDIRLYCDSDFAGDERRRRSRTGYFIFVNSALILFLSKQQATVETSVFGAEFVAMKHGIEAIFSLRYKLRMMGIPLTGPAFIYGDNSSVIKNTSIPTSVLNKKSNQVCYHYVREAVAMDVCRTGYVNSDDNPADLATKIIYGGRKRDHLVNMLLYDITEH
jgi:hypothetical protein